MFPGAEAKCHGASMTMVLQCIAMVPWWYYRSYLAPFCTTGQKLKWIDHKRKQVPDVYSTSGMSATVIRLFDMNITFREVLTV